MLNIVCKTLQMERSNTAQKMKFSIKDFFRKFDQLYRKLRIWSHLLRKSLMENFIFRAVQRVLGFILLTCFSSLSGAEIRLTISLTQPKKLDFKSSKHNQILCAKLLFLFGGCNSCVKGANCLNLGQGLEVVLFNFLSQSCRTVALYYTQYYSKIF